MDAMTQKSSQSSPYIIKNYPTTGSNQPFSHYWLGSCGSQPRCSPFYLLEGFCDDHSGP